jgi:hypothetical protein
MRQAVENHEPIVVERGGKSHVVILSVTAYERLLTGQLNSEWKHLVDQARTQIRSELRGGNCHQPRRPCAG